jgi:hypothetical protein
VTWCNRVQHLSHPAVVGALSARNGSPATGCDVFGGRANITTAAAPGNTPGSNICPRAAPDPLGASPSAAPASPALQWFCAGWTRPGHGSGRSLTPSAGEDRPLTGPYPDHKIWCSYDTDILALVPPLLCPVRGECRSRSVPIRTQVNPHQLNDAGQRGCFALPEP